MKNLKRYILLALLLQSFSFLQAQVENYALKLTKGTTVDFKQISELNNLSEYTVQFWFNPKVWTKGATLFSRDRGASYWAMRLGNEGTLEYCVGNEIVSISDSQLATGKWAQITLSYDGSKLSVWVNNTDNTVQTSESYAIPSSQAYFKLGGEYDGRLDEIRLYNVAIDPEYHLWQNTLNYLHPNWDNLIAYWKLDQSCENIADYKLKHNGEQQGTARELVTDNDRFKYKVISAYTGYSRFFDRNFDRHKIMLTNDLLLLICTTSSDGSISIAAPDNSGVLTNCSYLEEYKGKQGVLSFNGAGAKMDVGENAFTPYDTYTFATWLYIDEWTEGAYLFRKEANDKVGFSVKFGKETNHELIARVNGNEFKVADKLENGKWIHLTVSGVSHAMTGAKYVIQFGFDGKTSWANSYPSTKVSYKVSQSDNKTTAVIGENLKGKLEQTTIWHIAKAEYDGGLLQNGVPLPDFKKTLSETLPYDCNSFWQYNDPKRPGFDSYSHTCFREILTAPYKNHKGYKVRVGITAHSNWQSDFYKADYREKLAKSIANLPNLGYDGVELDFEWCYSDFACNSNYGKLLQEIRKYWPKGKILTVSPHDYSYAFPKEYIQYADYYSFQNYGPQMELFKKEAILGRAERYQNAGYPKEKIAISFSPMTSVPYNAKGERLQGAEIALWFFHDSYTDPELDYYKSGESYYWFTGVKQARWRCQYAVDNDLHGAMYWDIGGDNPDTTHPLSVVRSASFAINSNVDTIIAFAPIPVSVQEQLADKRQLQVCVSSDKAVILTVLPLGMTAESLELLDSTGRLISEQKISNLLDRRVNTNVYGLSNGVYFVRVKSTSETIVQKVLFY